MSDIVKRRVAESVFRRPVKLSVQERIEAMMHRVEYRRMVDFEDREAVFHLRRNAYSRHKGDSDDWGADKIEEAHQPNNETIGLFIDKQLVGSFKITLTTQEYPDTQSRKFFPEEVDALLDAGKVIVDPGRFVASTKASRQYPELPYLLMKIPVMASLHFQADECLSLIRKEHKTFYQRIFNAEVIAGPKWYEPLQIEALLMTSHVNDIRDNVLDRFPFWRTSALEKRQLFGPAENMPAIQQRTRVAA